MSEVTRPQVETALAEYIDPYLEKDLLSAKCVKNIAIDGKRVTVDVVLGFPAAGIKDEMANTLKKKVESVAGVDSATVNISWKIAAHAAQKGVKHHQNIKNMIAVASGKGGVGKSLVTGLLATALAREGYKVGVLDADITGPSIPMLFGLHGPVEPGPIGIRPLQSWTGVKVISMNFLLESEDQPIIWRGPLIGRAITQLWGDVMWGDLDYLLVDLPPGTSDASLTTMQSLPVNGIVMVTTPQSLASMVVRKAIHMAQAVNTPIVGVVENMAYFICPDTGKRHFIFGPSHVSEVMLTAGAPLLAQLPIDPQVSALCDTGNVELVILAEIPELLKAFAQAMPVMVRHSV